MVGVERTTEPLFRWQGSNERSPDLEWMESVESQVPRIHDLLLVLLRARWGLPLSPDAISVEFLSQGAWNRAFKVAIKYGGCLPQSCPLVEDYDRASGSYRAILRLSVPIERSLKTLSEVATLQWVKKCTAIPVPRVFMYDATGDSLGGYEWILMEQMPGQPFSSMRDGLDDGAKTSLARTIAEWVHALWSIRYDAIGSLYEEDGIESLMKRTGYEEGMSTNGVRDGVGDKKELRMHISQLCSQQYMGDWRPEYSFHRGPFSDLRSFCLSFVYATSAELRDDRQKQRSHIEKLCSDIYDDDLECIADKPALPVAKRNRTKRYLEAETSAEREKRQHRLEANKADLMAHMASYFPGESAEASRSLMGLFYREVAAPLDVGITTEFTRFNANRPGRRVRRVRENGVVTLHQCRYELEHWEHHESVIERLAHVIDTVVPDDGLPAGSCVLHHWDISENNVLVDAEGRATALLDWEQMFTIPVLPLINSAKSANTCSTSVRETAAPSAESLVDAVPLPPIFKPMGNSSEYRYSHRPSPSKTPPWQSFACELKSWQLKQMRLAYVGRLRELFAAQSTRGSNHQFEVSTFTTRYNMDPKGGENKTSAMPYGWSNKTPTPEEDQLVEKILYKIPNTWIGPSFVEELVLEAEDVIGI